MSDPYIPGQPGCEWMYDIFQEVPRASVQEPVCHYPGTATDEVEVDAFVEHGRPSLWDLHIEEEQSQYIRFDCSFHPDAPSHDQAYSSYEFASGATSYDPPLDPSMFYPIYAIQRGSFLRPANVEQALYQPHSGSYDDAPHVQYTPTSPPLTDYGHSSLTSSQEHAGPQWHEVTGSYAYSTTHLANASGSSSSAVASNSVVVPPLAPASFPSSLMEGPSAVSSRFGSSYAALNYRLGDGYRASELEFTSTSTEAESPWDLCINPDGPSSTFTTPPSSGELLSSVGVFDHRERTTTGPVEESTTVREIEQRPYKRYWMSEPERINYGPHGMMLSTALRRGRGGYRHSDRLAFRNIKMSQKMSIRFLVRRTYTLCILFPA
ncbi:hypothetical protein L226DRAFT_254684 [Lentinus tigrinus ALCF2SS1-7]|uniref:uncharacterized protein n=1 Tax=Lentinus tigrinus ALCF2SS1-7 TaxID=1328758 RepID=UPI001165D21B|nr:hypothetical protein L226DRAFT_254684 [Lentinus tigrinus ALCF2SS1-7]